MKIDFVCIAVMVLAVAATLLFMNGEALGMTAASSAPGYETRLYHNLMKNNTYYTQYHEYFDYLIESYFESRYFEAFVKEIAAMIAPYVEKDPTAFCSYEDWQLGVETITDFCLLRAESIRGQLDGTIPSTIAAQAKDTSSFVDASAIWLPDLGKIADLKD